MPRPQAGGTRASATKTNPISGWLESRRLRKQQEAENAARKITDETAQNENILQTTLEGIDFIHSELPKEILEARAKEGQKYGDLEQTARGLAQKLRKNPLTVNADIRKLDEKLLVLAELYKNAIEAGETHAAYAAKKALVKGILEVRSRIPQCREELLEQFVEINAKYLDEWITLVQMAQTADHLKKNTENTKTKYNRSKDTYQTQITELLEGLQQEQETADALAFVKNQKSTETRTTWTPVQRQVYGMLLEQRLKRVGIDMAAHQYQSLKDSFEVTCGEVDQLAMKLESIPLVTDENLKNKYKDAIDGLFMELAKRDTELEESLRGLEEIEGRILQLEAAPGNQLAKEVVANEAEVFLKEARALQQKEIGEREQDRGERLRELGLLTTEEVETERRQVEEENQRILERLAEEVEDTDGELNYN